MKLFKCIATKSNGNIPKGTNVEILSTSNPGRIEIRNAVERKYGIQLKDSDVNTTSWEIN